MISGNIKVTSVAGIAPLIAQLRRLIAEARSHSLRAVDVVQVRTCWEIGYHIVEFEQGGQARAAYGKRLLPMLAEQLGREFGKGFAAQRGGINRTRATTYRHR